MSTITETQNIWSWKGPTMSGYFILNKILLIWIFLDGNYSLYYVLLFFSIISLQLIRDMKNFFLAKVCYTFEDLHAFLLSLSIKQTLYIHSSLWVCDSSYTQKSLPSDLRPELPISYGFFTCEQKWTDLNLRSSDPGVKIWSLWLS